MAKFNEEKNCIELTSTDCIEFCTSCLLCGESIPIRTGGSDGT